jgi:hypothetical protein
LTRSRAATAIGVLLVVALGIFGAIAYFNARDSSTVSSSQGPGHERPAGERPVVKPGNVLLLYADPKFAPQLRRLQRDLSGTDKSLVAAGQAVIVQRAPKLPGGIAALSARHRLAAGRPDDESLTGFIEYWLGRKSG